MNLIPQRHAVILLALALVMLATRALHFGPVPDASWAVFFLAGLYLPGAGIFGLLFGLAVLIDYLATQQFGVSSYCISPAYPFLLPAYAALWAGGAWLRRTQRSLRARDAGWVAAALAVSVSFCFVLSNGSFYWLGGRHAAPSWSGWLANAWQWCPRFLWVPFVYVTLAAAIQALGTALVRQRYGAAATPR